MQISLCSRLHTATFATNSLMSEFIFRSFVPVYRFATFTTIPFSSSVRLSGISSSMIETESRAPPAQGEAHGSGREATHRERAIGRWAPPWDARIARVLGNAKSTSVWRRWFTGRRDRAWRATSSRRRLSRRRRGSARAMLSVTAQMEPIRVRLNGTTPCSGLLRHSMFAFMEPLRPC